MKRGLKAKKVVAVDSWHPMIGKIPTVDATRNATTNRLEVVDIIFDERLKFYHPLMTDVRRRAIGIIYQMRSIWIEHINNQVGIPFNRIEAAKALFLAIEKFNEEIINRFEHTKWRSWELHSISALRTAYHALRIMSEGKLFDGEEYEDTKVRLKKSDSIELFFMSDIVMMIRSSEDETARLIASLSSQINIGNKIKKSASNRGIKRMSEIHIVDKLIAKLALEISQKHPTMSKTDIARLISKKLSEEGITRAVSTIRQKI